MHDTSRVHPIRTALDRQWPPMSQARLARELGMNENQLRAYLKFKHMPPEGFYIAAARVLGCEPGDLKPEELAAA